jgi:DNA-binding transcriptional LysR family regulator
MDKLKGIQTFIAIAECGSLTAASHRLNVSLPTVVRSLAELERKLGVTLFNRTTRRISITDEGQRYLASCRIVIAQLEEIEHALTATRTKPSGLLTVTSSVLFGRMHIAPLMRRFLKRYPDVSTELVLLDRVVDLVEEGIDVGIRIGQLPDSTLHGVNVGMVRRVLCASPSYLKRCGTPKHPHDLFRHSTIQFRGLGSAKKMHFVDNGQNIDVRIEPRFITNSIDAALGAAVDGLGIGQFLSYMVEPLIRDRSLRLLLETFEPPGMPVTVVYPHSRLMSAKVRTFVDESIAPLRKSLETGHQ